MISLDLEQVPVAIHSLSPTAICRDFKDPEVLASPSNFTVLRESGRSAGGYERSSRNSPLSATRILARCGAWTCTERQPVKKRNETKQSTDGTQLAGAAGPPNALRACAGSGTLGSE